MNGRMHGESIPRMPATNAIIKETLTAKSAVDFWLYSLIFCSPIGSFSNAKTDMTDTNITDKDIITKITKKNKEDLFILQ